MKIILFSILLIFLYGCSALVPHPSENDDTLGWDLTYKSIVKENKIRKSEWIWKWLNDKDLTGFKSNYNYFVSPVDSLISYWNKSPIISSILLDYPSFHDG